MKFVCKTCGYVFSVENHEMDYENVMDLVPEDFECPNCGVTKSQIKPCKD